MCVKDSGMEDAASDLIALNARIRAGTLFSNFEGRNASEDLYRGLERFGLARADVMILSICPDGDDTVIGDLTTKDGRLYSFDLDLSDPEYSRLESLHFTATKRKGHADHVAEAAARWFKDR